jgi:hypothetical protein
MVTCLLKYRSHVKTIPEEADMFKFSKIKTKVAQLAAAGLVLSSLVVPAIAGAASEPRDNDANAIMWGGAYSKTEWQTKVHNGDGHNSAANLQQIYFKEGRGITEASVMSGDTVNGTVFKDGHVEVSGKTVAKDALSSGRFHTEGKTQSGSVWEGPTQKAFVADSIPAFVNMSGGTFHYAIVKSCGNPIKATPTTKPTPTPTATPKPTPTATPAPEQVFECVKLNVSQPDAKQTDTFRFTVESKIKNVTLTGYRFNIHQEGTDLATDVRDIDAKQNFAEYTLGEGTWTVAAQVKTSAGITAVNKDCSAKVVVAPASTPTPTPTPAGKVLGVTTLPDTGAESLLGGVAGVTAIGYAARGYLRSKRSVLDALRGKDQTKN